MPRGGKRPGAGAKKGSKHAATITKEQAREALRTVVINEMAGMLAAQIAHAKGLKYLVARNKKTGKFERVSATRMEALLESDNDAELEAVEVWDKDPSVQAFTDLMNRAIDKPAEQAQKLEISGQIDVTTILQQRHARHRKAS